MRETRLNLKKLYEDLKKLETRKQSVLSFNATGHAVELKERILGDINSKIERTNQLIEGLKITVIIK